MYLTLLKMKIHNACQTFNKLSKIFQPRHIIPENATIKKYDTVSKGQKLMVDLGIIRHANPGCYALLPFGVRAMEKLTSIVDEEMAKVGAQKIVLPTLTDVQLWKTTGRLKTTGKELFILEDRHQKKYVLGPTHEEAISNMLSSLPTLSYKHFPLRLYQISSKYRDEIKPRFGLMRGREFLMKDLYTFDTDIKDAAKTYEEICTGYEAIFDKIGIKYVKVIGTTGNIGGLKSHEFHYLAEIGEDELIQCENCNFYANIEVCETKSCPECKNSDKMKKKCGIEVGHTFLLGDKYSTPLNVKYLGQNGKPSVLQMGCYGLGLSRILAASIEVLSNKKEIRWPLSLAPYSILIIPPKSGSKEEETTSKFIAEIYNSLNSIEKLKNNILLDDRTNITIGKRIFEGRRFGYPFIIVIGSSATQDPPLFELHDLVNNTENNFVQSDLISYIHNKV